MIINFYYSIQGYAEIKEPSQTAKRAFDMLQEELDIIEACSLRISVLEEVFREELAIESIIELCHTGK
jgi:hypothetical protein